MKKTIVVFALFLLSIMQFSCTKEEVIPNVTASDIYGNYQITYMGSNKTSYEMPYNADGLTLSGIMQFVQNTPGTVTSRVMVFVAGAVQMDVITNLEIKNSTTESCDLYEKGLKVAKFYKVGGVKLIEFNGIDQQGNRSIIRAKN